MARTTTKKTTKRTTTKRVTKAPVQQQPTFTVTDLRDLLAGLIILGRVAYDDTPIDNSYRNEIILIAQRSIAAAHKTGLNSDALGVGLNEVIESGQLLRYKGELIAFLKQLTSFQKDLSRNVSMSPTLLSMLNDARLLANGSESALKRINENIGILKEPALIRMFTKNTGSITQKDVLPQLKAVVKKLGGKGVDLTLEERKKLRTSTKGATVKLYQDYLALRRAAVEPSKDFVRNWVRSNSDKKGMADYKAMLKALKTAGFEIHAFAPGYDGFIDDMGRLFTKTGKLINGKPGTPGTVEMNKQYDPETDDTYVFKAFVDGAKTVTLYYTTEYKKASNEAKFSKVGSLAKHVEPMRRKWLSILKAGGRDEHDPRFLASMVLEIVYHTQGRIGGERGSTDVGDKTVKTFGIASLRCKHARAVGNGVNLNYLGKKAQKQQHKLVASEGPGLKKIIKLILEWKDERGPNDPIFMTRRGGSLTASTVNALLRELGAPDGVTVHKFRHLKGIQMMGEIVERQPFAKKKAKSAAEVTAWIKKEALAIGKQLGHMSGEKFTSATAIANYLEPNMMISIYRAAGFPPPVAMLKLVGVDTKSFEGLDTGDDE